VLPLERAAGGVFAGDLAAKFGYDARLQMGR